MFLYGEVEAEQDEESFFDVVARENAPLDDYHPQMLLQCLLWGTSRPGYLRNFTDIRQAKSNS
jgi:hypothetical protein